MDLATIAKELNLPVSTVKKESLKNFLEKNFWKQKVNFSFWQTNMA